MAWGALLLAGVGGATCGVAWFARSCCPATVDRMLLSLVPLSAMAGIALGIRSRRSPLGRQAVVLGSLVLVIGLGSLVILRLRSAPAIAGAPAARGVVTPDPGIVVRIPGARVELAGVSVDWYGAMSPVWWKADGLPLKVRSWAMDPGYVPTVVARRQQRLFALIARGDVEAARIVAFTIDGTPGAYREFSIQSADSRPGEWRGLARIFARDKLTTTVRVLVGAGPFQPARLAAAPRQGDAVTGAFDDVEFSCGEVVDQGGKATVQVTRSGSPAGPLYEYRLRARDRRGGWHVANVAGPNSPAPGEATIEHYAFSGLAADDVAGIQLERRPAWWVEFQNVALNMDHPTPARGVLLDHLP